MSSELGAPNISLLFYSFAPQDYGFVKLLEKHMEGLKRQKLITSWHRQILEGGMNVAQEITQHMQEAQLILLLLSSDFMVPDDRYVDLEVERAMELHKAGTAAVVPVFVRSVHIAGLPWADWYSLPENSGDPPLPVDLWPNRDQAFAAIVRSIHRLIKSISAHKTPALSSAVPPRTPVPSFWNLPYSRNPHFADREQALQQLLQAPAQTPRKVVLSGPEGSGKTQLALEYAERFKASYQSAFWVRGDSPANLATDFQDLTRRLVLPERRAGMQESAREALKRWFKQEEDWLLIFDNVEDATLLDEFLPVAGRGVILVTGRAQLSTALPTTLELSYMEPDEGAIMLLERTGKLEHGLPLQKARTSQVAKARHLSRTLAGLPLALDLAGSYMAATATAFADYITAYQRLSVQGEQSEQASIVHIVQTTFKLTWERLKQSERAQELQQLCAFLHPDSIPEDFFYQDMLDLPPDVRLALDTLQSYGLIQRNAQQGIFMLHRHLQQALRRELSAIEQRQLAERAVKLVNAAFPEIVYPDWERCQQALPHALLCRDLIEQWNIVSEEAADLLRKSGEYLYERAQYSSVRALYEQALALYKQLPEPNQASVGQLYYVLGELERREGHYSEAEAALQQALQIRVQVFGPDHRDVARTLNRQGVLAQTEENLVRAKELYTQALNTYRRSTNGNTSEIGGVIGNLAGIVEALGDPTQAGLLYMQAQEISEDFGEADQPRAVRALIKLARFYRVQKQYAEAEELFVKARPLMEQTFGAIHPETATYLNNFSVLYRELGNYVESEQLVLEAIRIWIQLFGEEYRLLVNGQHNLARTYDGWHKNELAEHKYKQALVLSIRINGPDDDKTLEIYNDWKDLRKRIGGEEPPLPTDDSV